MTDDLDQRLLNQYEQNRHLYNSIERQLDAVYDRIMDGPDVVAKTLLYQADVFAIVSVQTHVSVHERGFMRIIGLDSADEIAGELGDLRGPNNQAVMYHNNKSEYIVDAIQNVDYARQLELFRAREFDELNRYKIDHVKGLKMAKSAFSLAMCGVTDRMCVDSNVARIFGYEWDDVPNTVVVETYQDFCDELVAEAPSLARRTSRFIYQWVAFDVARGVGITPHDSWFLQVEKTCEEPLPELTV